MLKQIIRTIKIRRAPAGHYNRDCNPIITKISGIIPVSLVTAERDMIVKIIICW